MLRTAVCAAAIVTATACAARVPVLRVDPGVPAAGLHARDDQALETFVDRLGASGDWAPPERASARTIEASDQALAAALFVASVHPSAAAHRVVAKQYVRLGILDLAQDHLSAAASLDPQDAAAWEGMARIWRDWGFPRMGLPDAYRALYFAPNWPEAHRTLGTILLEMGRGEQASTYLLNALLLEYRRDERTGSVDGRPHGKEGE